MSDFLSELTAEDAPVAREVQYGDKSGIVYFRKLSAGQLTKVLKNLTIERKPGETGAVTLSLAGNQERQELMVFYCVCDEHGKRRYLNFSDIENMPAGKLQVLAEHADAVNSEKDMTPGKA